MIHDLDETIKQILIKKGKLNAGDIDIAFDQPTGEWTASLNRPTINLYLYDMRENLELRNTSHIKTERHNGRGGKRVYPSKRIDLSYLITVWARNPEDEHQLLWRVLRTLSLSRSIKPETGIGMVREQPFDLPIKVALPSDAVRNLPDLWGVMENQLKPSVNLLVTVALDTQLVVEAPLVLTSTLRVGQSAHPLEQEMTAVDVSIYHIGGRVLHQGMPVGEGVEVTLLNRGDTVETDASGQYVFAYMQPGEYDVEVVADGRKPKRFTITVPNDDHTDPRNFDLSL